MNPKKQFDQYRVTNGHVRFKGADGEYEEAIDLGCTGSLNLETEMRTIVKNCEGVQELEVSRPVKVTGTLTGHMSVKVLRDVYGINTEGLKSGVYGYGKNSKSKVGAWTWDVEDLFGSEIKKLAIPVLSASSGFRWSLENGGDEVAEVELEFSAGLDDNGYFYYEAFESDLAENPEVEQKWHTEFSPELVAQGEVPGV